MAHATVNQTRNSWYVKSKRLINQRLERSNRIQVKRNWFPFCFISLLQFMWFFIFVYFLIQPQYMRTHAATAWSDEMMEIAANHPFLYRIWK